jgi:endonuclease III
LIDPENITNYHLDKYGLEEVALFWVLVAGKTAKVVAKRLDAILEEGFSKVQQSKATPFDAIRAFGKQLPEVLRRHGIGCYSSKAKSILELVSKDIDLKTCTVEELESIWGIGPKTSRCFILHSRKDAKCGGLDTHILHFLRDQGYDVPDSTPSSMKKYREVEKAWLGFANRRRGKKSLAEYDLMIWNRYSRK